MSSKTINSLRVGSFNIRYDGLADAPVPLAPPGTDDPQLRANASWPPSTPLQYGEQPWSERRYRLVSQLISANLDVFGLQEALYNQLQDIATLLGEGWEWYGVGRDDGVVGGEFSPVFYRKDRFELVSKQTFWLSPTPDVPGSVGWGADLTRIATLVTLRDRDIKASDTRSEYHHFVASHWDHKSEKARAESALVIRREVAARVQATEKQLGVQQPGKALIVFMADINSPETEAGYQVLTDYRYNGTAAANTTSSDAELTLSFLDSYYAVHLRSDVPLSSDSRQAVRQGTHDTFSGFSETSESSRIDVVALGSNAALSPGEEGSGWRVERFAVFENYAAGSWPYRFSDHKLVVAEVRA